MLALAASGCKHTMIASRMVAEVSNARAKLPLPNRIPFGLSGIATGQRSA